MSKKIYNFANIKIDNKIKITFKYFKKYNK